MPVPAPLIHKMAHASFLRGRCIVRSSVRRPVSRRILTCRSWRASFLPHTRAPRATPNVTQDAQRAAHQARLLAAPERLTVPVRTLQPKRLAQLLCARMLSSQTWGEGHGDPLVSTHQQPPRPPTTTTTSPTSSTTPKPPLIPSPLPARLIQT